MGVATCGGRSSDDRRPEFLGAAGADFNPGRRRVADAPAAARCATGSVRADVSVDEHRPSRKPGLRPVAHRGAAGNQRTDRTIRRGGYAADLRLRVRMAGTGVQPTNGTTLAMVERTGRGAVRIASPAGDTASRG